MQLNPIAFLFWIMCAGIGYLCSDNPIRGAITGVVIGIGISFIVGIINEILNTRRRRRF